MYTMDLWLNLIINLFYSIVFKKKSSEGLRKIWEDLKIRKNKRAF